MKKTVLCGSDYMYPRVVDVFLFQTGGGQLGLKIKIFLRLSLFVCCCLLFCLLFVVNVTTYSLWTFQFYDTHLSFFATKNIRKLLLVMKFTRNSDITSDISPVR